MVYLPLTSHKSEKHMVAFSVPKRRVKKAVDRNRIKRQMRAAYRLNKFDSEKNQKKYGIMFIYIGPNPSDYQSIENAIQTLKKRIFSSQNDKA